MTIKNNDLATQESQIIIILPTCFLIEPFFQLQITLTYSINRTYLDVTICQTCCILGLLSVVLGSTSGLMGRCTLPKYATDFMFFGTFIYKSPKLATQLELGPSHPYSCNDLTTVYYKQNKPSLGLFASILGSKCNVNLLNC